LASAIQTLLDDPGRAAAFSRRSLAVFQERFTLKQSVAGMVDLYNRVALMRR
jgi:hypothetical protein